MIEYKDLQGNDGAFNPALFVLMRPTSADFEPENAVHVRLDGEVFDVSTPLAHLAEQLRNFEVLINLRAPNGVALWIAASRVLSVSAALSGLYHPSANAIVKLHVTSGPTITRAVQQTVAEVNALL